MFYSNNDFLRPRYQLVTDNDNLAVSLDDVKAWLKIDITTDDALITSLIKAATLEIEKYIRRELLTKLFILYLDTFPLQSILSLSYRYSNYNNILVKRSKLNDIASIEYFSDSVLTVFDNSLYDFTFDNQYAEIYLIDLNSVWPITDIRKQAVQITFSAGFGVDESFVPEDLKLALKMLVAFLYENRGDCNTTLSTGGTSSTTEESMLIGIKAILNLYKIEEI